MSLIENSSSDGQLNTNTAREAVHGTDDSSVVTQDILQALKGLQFGEVTITVRDGKVVQIERITRKRQILPKQSS